MRLVYTGGQSAVVGPFEGVAVRDGDAVEVPDEKVAESLIARGDWKKHVEPKAEKPKAEKPRF